MRALKFSCWKTWALYKFVISNWFALDIDFLRIEFISRVCGVTKYTKAVIKIECNKLCKSKCALIYIMKESLVKYNFKRKRLAKILYMKLKHRAIAVAVIPLSEFIILYVSYKTSKDCTENIFHRNHVVH